MIVCEVIQTHDVISNLFLAIYGRNLAWKGRYSKGSMSFSKSYYTLVDDFVSVIITEIVPCRFLCWISFSQLRFIRMSQSQIIIDHSKASFQSVHPIFHLFFFRFFKGNMRIIPFKKRKLCVRGLFGIISLCFGFQCKIITLLYSYNYSCLIRWFVLMEAKHPPKFSFINCTIVGQVIEDGNFRLH